MNDELKRLFDELDTLEKLNTALAISALPSEPATTHQLQRLCFAQLGMVLKYLENSGIPFDTTLPLRMLAEGMDSVLAGHTSRLFEPQAAKVPGQVPVGRELFRTLCALLVEAYMDALPASTVSRERGALKAVARKLQNFGIEKPDTSESTEGVQYTDGAIRKWRQRLLGVELFQERLRQCRSLPEWPALHDKAAAESLADTWLTRLRLEHGKVRRQ